MRSTAPSAPGVPVSGGHASITTVLFDLDGTLTDPGEGITKSMQEALRFFGIEKTLDELKICIGPPLTESFGNILGLSAEQVPLAIEKYRARYARVVVIENALYDGVPEMLRALRQAGLTVGLATSKPEFFAKQVLDAFSLSNLVDVLTGSGLDGTRNEKWQVVEEAMRRCGEENPDRVLMVGDRKYDVLGAARLGVRTVGAAWGYGTVDELREAGAWNIAMHPADCARLILAAMQ